MLTAAVGCAGAAGGVLALRRAWRVRDTARPAWMLCGWALLVVDIFAWALEARLDKALALASLALALAAYGLIAATAERREPGGRRMREAPGVEPQARPKRWVPASLRFLTAAGLAAAFGGGAGLALARLPGLGAGDAMVLGGMAGPLAWAGAMVWALADPRPGRPAASLAALCVLLIGIGAWPR